MCKPTQFTFTIMYIHNHVLSGPGHPERCHAVCAAAAQGIYTDAHSL